MTKPFAVSNRTPNGYYVDVAPGHGWLEMTPRWLSDGQTLELGLIEVVGSIAGSRQRARVRFSVPQLDEALKWCTERRMGMKLICVEARPHPEFAQLCQEIDEQRRTKTLWSNVLEISCASNKCYASYRLVFQRIRHAIEFKIAWC